MSETPRDLLREPLLAVDLPDGARTPLSLPEVLAKLASGERLEFAALRAHQLPAWYAFLVQLAALALHRAGELTPWQDPERWGDALLELAGGSEAAWSLVVEDLAQPAFFQPPIPEGSLEAAGYRPAGTLPDAIDVLITAKNHDVKQLRMRAPRPEHWVYALVTLQTTEGFLGRGNYGVSRMNGGFASRPALAATPELSWPARFARDVRVWLEHRPKLVEGALGYPASGGHALLWTLPWDGRSSLPLQACDPFYLEVCRRVRLTAAGNELAAWVGSSECARLDAKELKGDTGDAWTPIKKADHAALTVGEGGFSYRLLRDLLFEEKYTRPPALELRRDDGEHPTFTAQVLARGQGETQGFHERYLPLPRKARLLLSSSEGRERLGKLAERRIAAVELAQRKVLHPALCALLQNGKEELDLRDERTRPWTRRLDRAIDRIFFEHLWRDAALDGGAADTAWEEYLFDLTEQTLAQAVDAVPHSDVRRHRAIARAEITLRRNARKNLPRAFPDPATPAKEETPADEP